MCPVVNQAYRYCFVLLFPTHEGFNGPVIETPGLEIRVGLSYIMRV